MNKKDYYEILGINKNASEAEIKSAFRKLAKENHPDVSKNPNAEAKFKELQEAYAVLSDKEKRQQYDQHGHSAFEGGFGGTSGFDFSGFDFSDIFSDIFGSSFGFGSQGGHANRPKKGRDVIIEMGLSFKDAVFGIEKTINIDVDETCKDCHGHGGTGEKTCSKCHGSGTITMEQRTMLGAYLTKTTCTSCQGSGSIYDKTCSKCHGKGTKRKNKEIVIKVPAGVDNGNQLRIPGKGEAGVNGGPKGDLYVEFYIDKDPLFVRKGDNVKLNIPITITEAILGCKKEIPTLYGEVILTIPPGTQSGSEFLLKGKGIANVNSNKKGDMFAIIDVIIPDKLDKKQKELIHNLAKTPLEQHEIFKKFDKNIKRR